MSKALKTYYESKRELENEYYENNKYTLDLLKNKDISRLYRIVVNPYKFCLFEGISLFLITKKTFGSFKVFNKSKVPFYFGKVFVFSILNWNFFSMKSNKTYQLLKEKKKKNSLSTICSSFLNPLFLIQKDKLIISTIQLFNRKSNNCVEIKKDTIKPITFQSNIKEGFL